MAKESLPEFQTLNDAIYGRGSQFSPFGQSALPGQSAQIPKGKELFEGLYEQYKTGLPQGVKDILLKQGRSQIGSNLAEGNQSLNESLARTGGNVPLDALIKGKSDLQTGANKEIAGLNDTLAMRDYDARNTSLQQLYQLLGIASEQAGAFNDYNINKYNIDSQNSFSVGDFLGNLIGAGGVIGGGILARSGRRKALGN